MKNSYDVLGLGELLIDFIGSGQSERHHPLYEANPGGAPCNVLSMLANLGRKTCFIGKVGDDAFGRQLENAIIDAGISTEGLKFDRKYPTTLAFVHHTSDGDRSFTFYRGEGADTKLSEEDLDADLFRRAALFHFGSLSLTSEPARSATRKALAYAEENELLRSYDPNLREALWDNEEHAREEIGWGMEHCDLLKISDNEALWFTRDNDLDEAIYDIRARYENIKLICLSMGEQGSRAYYRNLKAFAPAYRSDRTIDTTGAGDTFCACIIDYVLTNGMFFESEQEMEGMLRYANAAASIVTRRKGALSVMPTRGEIEALIRAEK